MSAEAIIRSTLSALVGDRIYPLVAPTGTACPYITFQQVGGSAINFFDGALPGRRNGRYQVNVWAEGMPQAAALARQVEDALRVAPGLQTTVLGAPVADYEEDTELFGTMQDFSFWTD